jgi:hypothetical protein
MSPGYDGFKSILLGFDDGVVTRIEPVEHTGEGSGHTESDVLEVLIYFSKECVEGSIADIGTDRQALVVGLWVSFIVLWTEELRMELTRLSNARPAVIGVRSARRLGEGERKRC